MAFMEWKSNYETKVDPFDEHHHRLFDLINQLYEGVFQCQDLSDEQQLTSKTLKELADYVQYHFEAEEKFMRDMNFSGLEVQMKQHQVFAAKVLLLQNQHESGQATLSLDTFLFLKDWLSEHILGLDKQYESTDKKSS